MQGSGTGTSKTLFIVTQFCDSMHFKCKWVHMQLITRGWHQSTTENKLNQTQFFPGCSLFEMIKRKLFHSYIFLKLKSFKYCSLVQAIGWRSGLKTCYTVFTLSYLNSLYMQVKNLSRRVLVGNRDNNNNKEQASELHFYFGCNCSSLKWLTLETYISKGEAWAGGFEIPR